jgi:hypothetical protein
MSDVACPDERDIEILRERISQGDETAWIELRSVAITLNRDDLVAFADRRIDEMVASGSTSSDSMSISCLVDVKHGAPSAVPTKLLPTVSVLAELDGGFWGSHEAPLSNVLGRYLQQLKGSLLENFDDLEPSILPDGETFWSYFLRSQDLANHVTADGVTFSSPDVDCEILERFMLDSFMLYPAD